MFLLQLIEHILQMAFAMSQEMLWPIVLGLLLSAAIQTLVSKTQVAQALGKTTPKSMMLAAAAGAASSSCSYAATALARTLFQKGATLANSIIFEFGSTNLVFDLGVVIFALLGWQFLAAQYLGGCLMIAVLFLLFKFTLTPELEKAARNQAQRGLAGKMEAHASMDMTPDMTPGISLSGTSPLLKSILPGQTLTAISHYFCMDLMSLLPDLVSGILIASVLSTIVPDNLWQKIFLTQNTTLAFFWGPIIGPIISMLSFVCSIGNVPLALVLWQKGISFGGVIAFIFADLLIFPILDIYRKYYGAKVAVYLTIVSYVSIVLASMSVELIFSCLKIAPARLVLQTLAAEQLHLGYIAVLNTIAAILMAFCGWRFFATGGSAMLKNMDGCNKCGSI